jgi:hypothetical protein
VTVNDVLDGHVVLDECLDRIYLNGYVPNLQVEGSGVSFRTQHSGKPIASAGDPGADRHRVSSRGAQLRRRQQDPGGAVH